MAHTEGRGHRPPPTPQIIDEAREYASELHYAFHERPRTTAPLRDRWDRHFRSVSQTLIGLLNRYKFTCLPRVALGAIWENNTHIHNWRAQHGPNAPIVCYYYLHCTLHANDELQPPYNTEAVRPLEFDHAAFNASVEIRQERLGNLHGDDEDPTFGILDRNEVHTKWWEAYAGKCVVAMYF